MQKVTVIIPCAGESSRFPNVRPKWSLTYKNSKPMVVESMSGIKNYGRVIITILKSHDEKYDAKLGLIDAFRDSGVEVEVHILERKTASQTETIYRTIEDLKLEGPIFIKDCDNKFQFDLDRALVDGENYLNGVCIEDLHNVQDIFPNNKSYVTLSDDELVEELVEKKIISSKFSVGGYLFSNCESFKDFYNGLKLISSYIEGGPYVSDILDALIKKGDSVMSYPVTGYEDWGTLEDWKRYNLIQKNYIFDIDGVLMSSSGKYFKPRYSMDTNPVKKNVELVNRLYDNGNRIILMTARDSSLRDFTEKQLEKNGVKYHVLLMDNLHACRVIVNDYSGTNPYPSAVAYSISRDFDKLEEIIK